MNTTPSRSFAAPAHCIAGLALLACLILLPGCACFAPESAHGPSYAPQNVFVWSPCLPPTVKRVAVLPLQVDDADVALQQGRDSLEPILQAELAKAKRFEVFRASPEFLDARIGQAGWGCDSQLPPQLLGALGDAGCDAILFCKLTVFRGYAPLAVGWRLRLVDLRSQMTLWAADEVFDAGMPSVVTGARRYEEAEAQGDKRPDGWVICNSPRQFAQYAAAELFATLPSR